MSEQFQVWTLLDSEQGIVSGNATQIEPHQHLCCKTHHLKGGIRDGVIVIELSNHVVSINIVPTRGMSIADVHCGDVRLGWNSPVQGPVHPRFVPIAEPNGLGWLDGFDEWLVRCGLSSNGAPDFDEQGRLQHSLHGRIANRPAHQVKLTFDHETSELALTGVVDETRFLFYHLRLTSTIRLRPDATTFQIHDRVENLSGRPATAQLLYHINFGPTLLSPGAELVVPAKRIAPRNAHAANDVDTWNLYGQPDASYEEQVYFMQLQADENHRTLALLKSDDGQHGAAIRFNIQQLPYFSQWKNTVAYQDGYVTGIEPATNFPNPHSFERQQGRVISLAPNESRDFVIDVEVATTSNSVQRLETEVQKLQVKQPCEILKQPDPDWSAP